MLQDFLDSGLLEIGDDDQRLESFHAAAADLAGKIKEEPIRLIRYTAVAIDPNAPPEDAAFEDAEKAVKEHWRTYANRFPNRPTQILRAVLWQAISEAVNDEESGTTKAKAAVYLTARNLIDHVSAGREQDVVKGLVGRLGNEVEEAVSKTWGAQYTTSSTFSVPKLGTKIELGAVDVKELGKSLTYAAGPASGGTTNPYYPSNNPQQWNQAFGPAAATAVAAAIDSTTEEIASNVNKALESLAPGFAALAKSVQGALQTHATSASSGQKRLEMLWWKEALYSPSLKVGYRSLPEELALVAMARDMHATVGGLHPVSVEYFLRETVRTAFGEAAERPVSLLAFAEGFLQGIRSDAQYARALGLTSIVSSGRDGFVPYLAGLARGSVGLGSTKEILGIPEDAELLYMEYAVCVFRDLQARRVTEAG